MSSNKLKLSAQYCRELMSTVNSICTALFSGYQFPVEHPAHDECANFEKPVQIIDAHKAVNGKAVASESALLDRKQTRKELLNFQTMCTKTYNN